jgi:hypothetical protein
MNNIQIEHSQKNSEHEKQRNALYNKKVKELRNIQHKERFEKYPEKRQQRRDYIRQYKANRRLNDKEFVLHESLRKRIWKCIKNKSKHSIEYLGCSVEEYKKWIEFTMSNDMNWDNYGKFWNIDHVIPISAFNVENIEEMQKAFNWKNTRAIYASKNFRKKDKISEELCEEQKILLQKYEQS